MTDRLPESPASRTHVDIATGVLIGIHGGSVADAIDELFTTARHHRVSLFELSRTLITVAEGRDIERSSATDAVYEVWGSALGRRGAATHFGLVTDSAAL
ncbi:ANTAR domain-containing protein [Rhodococcus sp. 05-339-2]|uniref:ANTAR domain-containing protein n=1 Tax=Rhodococcoides fascians TaxID=1828 RepID=UPI00050C29C3|nr:MULTISPECIES: ANTAR domain-containing protein [Rhodococcus]OZD81595.1 ANTAR domain-containing protein [Rhodococcus sp. 05-339-2]